METYNKRLAYMPEKKKTPQYSAFVRYDITKELFNNACY